MKRQLFSIIAIIVLAFFFALPALARDMNKVYDDRDAAIAKGAAPKKPSNFQLKNSGNEGKVVGKDGNSKNTEQNRQPGSVPTRGR